MTKLSCIPTPMNVRWQRMRFQLLPVLSVVLCGTIAWQLWSAVPPMAAEGQVEGEVAEVASPASGTLSGATDTATGPHLYDTVAAGDVIARVQHKSGKWTDIKAPISGQVVKVEHLLNEEVEARETLFTISTVKGQYVTAYVRAGQQPQPTPGTAVAVRLRSDPTRTFQAVIDRVGPRYESVPSIYLRDRKAPEELGLPVRITIPREVNIKPGELVDVGWVNAKSGT